MGGEESGRARGVRIPALVAALQCGEATNALEEVHGFLDRLNAQYKVGLFPAERPAGDREIYAVQTTEPNAYGELGEGEVAAYAVVDDHLLVATSAELLARMVARYDWQVAIDEAQNGPWRRVREFETMPVASWFDLERSTETIRKGMYAFALVKMTSSDGGGSQGIEEVREAEAWLDTLVPLKELRVWNESTNDGMWRFHLGPPPPGDEPASQQEGT
jgi:hypothetical protein